MLIPKIIAYAVSFTFALLGLRDKFRDKDKKITLYSKAALVLIISSFIVSVFIAVLESRNAQTERARHEAELKRMIRPLGDLSVKATFQMHPTAADSPKLLRDLFNSYRHEVGVDASDAPTVDYHSAPTTRQSELPAYFNQDSKELDSTGDITILLFRKGIVSSCDRLAKGDWNFDADLSLDTLHGRRYLTKLKDDPTAEWSFQWNPNGEFLTLYRTLKLTYTWNTGGITSIEDLEGSVALVEENWDYHFFTLSKVELDAGNAIIRGVALREFGTPNNSFLCGKVGGEHYY